MCAPCKTVLNHIDEATARGGNMHRAVRIAIEDVMDDLPAEVQNKLSQLDAEHIRARLSMDKEYFERLTEILSDFAGVEF